jgi:hypothetical protein
MTKRKDNTMTKRKDNTKTKIKRTIQWLKEKGQHSD